MSVEETKLNGLPAVKLTHPSGATATVYVYAGHLASWKDSSGQENLFVSSKTAYGGGKAIRGGVPICWPQFAGRGEYQKHGFARNSADWKIVRTSTEPYPSVVLGLSDTEASRKLWPFPFKLTYSVTLDSDASISVSLSVINSGEQPLEFTTALHTYFSCASVAGTQVLGLEGVTYDDSVKGVEGAVQAGNAMPFQGEVDRIYYGTPRSLYVTGLQPNRAIKVLKMGFPDAVTWNIGKSRASSLADLDDYSKYVCLEAACIGKPVVLPPSNSWTAGQTFTVMSAAAAATEPDSTDDALANSTEAAEAEPVAA